MTSTQEKPNPKLLDRYNNAKQIIKGLFSNTPAINTIVRPTWIDNTDCFWYKRESKSSSNKIKTEFRLVDAQTATNTSAFDHLLLAIALSDVTGEHVDAEALPLSNIELNPAEKSVLFTAFCKRWKFCTQNHCCTEMSALPTENEVISPDGKYLVFGRDNNLWLKNLDNAKEHALTSDGEEDFTYGGTTMAWGEMHLPGLQVCWSPDSQRIFTLQKDTRHINPLPVVHHVPTDGSIRPQLHHHKIAFADDPHIETLRLLVIDIKTGKQQQADYSQIPTTRNGYGFFTANLGWWNKDSRLAYFVDVDRYYKYVRLIEFDTFTGKTRLLFEEVSDTQINLMNNGDMWPSFVPMPETNELLWYSERTGWAHLYLYDLQSGALKHAVTQGDWLVRDVITVNPERREVYLQTGCRSPDKNPYYRDVARVDIDTGALFTLASSHHDYFASAFTDICADLQRAREQAGTSLTGNYTVVTRSRVDTFPESVLIDRDGNTVLCLETAELCDMPAQWQWPEPVKMQANDGKTDIYGVVYRPSDFSADNTYPVILDVFNTPDFPCAPPGSFDTSIFGGMYFLNGSALAELGFVVVQIDGRGGSYRSKPFQSSGYGNLQLPDMLADQIAGLQQLAERYSFMDLSRLGIHELAGGPAVVRGLLDHAKLFKVGVSFIPHDARLMPEAMWSNMYEGQQKDPHTYPENSAENLTGKLLLMNGMLDLTCPPAGFFRIVEALQKANKDFDMLLLPNVGHQPSSYLMRRGWDYLVTHLRSEVPPENFDLALYDD